MIEVQLDAMANRDSVPRNWDFPPADNKAADLLIIRESKISGKSLSSQEKEAVHGINALQVDRIRYQMQSGVATSPAEFSATLPIYRKANLAVLTFHEVKFVEVEANLERRRLRSTKNKQKKKKEFGTNRACWYFVSI